MNSLGQEIRSFPSFLKSPDRKGRAGAHQTEDVHLIVLPGSLAPEDIGRAPQVGFKFLLRQFGHDKSGRLFGRSTRVFEQRQLARRFLILGA